LPHLGEHDDATMNIFLDQAENLPPEMAEDQIRAAFDPTDPIAQVGMFPGLENMDMAQLFADVDDPANIAAAQHIEQSHDRPDPEADLIPRSKRARRPDEGPSIPRDTAATPPIPTFTLRTSSRKRPEATTSTSSAPTQPILVASSAATTTSVPAAPIPPASAAQTTPVSAAQTAPVSAAVPTSTASASTSSATPDIKSLFFKINKLETDNLQLTGKVKTLETELEKQKKLYDDEMKTVKMIMGALILDVKELKAGFKPQGGESSGLGCKEDELQRKRREDEHDDSDAARDKNEPVNQAAAANIQEPGNAGDAGAGASTSGASQDKGKAPVTQEEAAAVTLAELFQQAGPSGSGINKYIYISSDSDSSSSEGSPDPTWRLFSHLDKYDCINAYHTHYEDKFAKEAQLELRQAQQQNENESIVIDSNSDSDSDYFPNAD
jgi:hypothetical protein